MHSVHGVYVYVCTRTYTHIYTINVYSIILQQHIRKYISVEYMYRCPVTVTLAETYVLSSTM